MKCKLTLAAKEIIISHDTGVPSAINIMEGIQASGFPLFLQEISVLTVWKKEADDPEESHGTMTVTIAGNELVKEAITLAFRGKDVARNIGIFQGLLLPSPGNLDFTCNFPNGSAICTVAVSNVSKMDSNTTN